MAIRFHLDEELLLDYAAGGMAEGWALAVATHLALCPACRGRSQDLDALGGVELEALAPVALKRDALEACMARLDAAPAPSPEATREMATPGGDAAPVFPSPLRAYVGGDVGDVRWRRVGGGVRQLMLPVGGSARARLLHISPGAVVPEHGHRGLELTLVLAGSFIDGDNAYLRGDIQAADGEVEHTPVAGAEAACVCLAVTDAPLRFTGLAPRLVQRFARI